MKTKITLLSYIGILLLAFVYQSCVYNDVTKTFSNTVTPQQLPSVVPGFNFPEDSLTIYNWLANRDTARITKHAWGIWAGLTANSDQIYMDDTLLIYETWLGITDIAAQCASGNTQDLQSKSIREQLHLPNQLTHGVTAPSSVDTNAVLYVSVSYDPNASSFAIDSSLLNQSTINRYMVNDGIGRIPPFPNNSITIKPTYFLGSADDELIRIPAWQGPPSNWGQVYGHKKWNSFVYADVNNSQTPGKIAVPVPDQGGNTPPSSAIVNLNEFIYYTLDSASAVYLNEQQAGQADTTVTAGDLVVLVAMHVATKEISNWTWQTFFWTTNPAQPDFPSSAWAASLQPSQLQGAAKNYAVATAYAMVWPNQPITGGTNQGATPIIGYNPYLEAGLPEFKNVNKLNSSFKYGMQSNCMSCHSRAKSNYSNQFEYKFYTADEYMDMGDTTFFNNWVQLDFAWSIQGNLNKNK